MYNFPLIDDSECPNRFNDNFESPKFSMSNLGTKYRMFLGFSVEQFVTNLDRNYFRISKKVTKFSKTSPTLPIILAMYHLEQLES